MNRYHSAIILIRRIPWQEVACKTKENRWSYWCFVFVIAIISSATTSIASYAQVTTSTGADMVVYNAHITTQNPAQPSASALAVKGGRIYAVGTNDEILELKGTETKLIDARGNRLIPGLNDAHIHFHKAGLRYNYAVRWDGVPNLKLALQILSDQAKRTPEGHWVKVVGGWSPYQFEENRLPTMEELNEAVPNRPFIVQYSYNVAFLNEKALEIIGVDKEDFWLPPFTRFERDKEGRLTGLLYGDPGSIMFWVIETIVPQPTPEEQENSLLQLTKEFNRLGLTSVIDAGGVSYPQEYGIMKKVITEDKLNLRYSFTDIGDGYTEMGEIEEEIHSITKLDPISPGQNLHPYLEHGYEYEGVGEAIRVEMLDYENFDRPPHILDPELIKEVISQDVSELVKRRIPFRIHVTYDENLTVMLDALEALNKELPFDGLRWGIEHAEMISTNNIARIQKLGAGITLQNKMAWHGDGFIKTYGREKALQTPPFRKLIESEIPLTLGTDGLRVSSFNPWIAMSWAVTGKAVSGTVVLAEDNRLTREEALRLYTLGSAWFQYDEDEKGRIAPGHLADFVLLDKDYFKVSEDQISTISSVLTILGGRVVYGVGEFEMLAPIIPEPIPDWSPVRYYPGYYIKN
ncbi:MAG: amidohydrolase [Cytophagales bacterium]|nr:amidohydrolase [Cytophagales bacterium]